MRLAALPLTVTASVPEALNELVSVPLTEWLALLLRHRVGEALLQPEAAGVGVGVKQPLALPVTQGAVPEGERLPPREGLIEALAQGEGEGSAEAVASSDPLAVLQAEAVALPCFAPPPPPPLLGVAQADTPGVVLGEVLCDTVRLLLALPGAAAVPLAPSAGEGEGVALTEPVPLPAPPAPVPLAVLLPAALAVPAAALPLRLPQALLEKLPVWLGDSVPLTLSVPLPLREAHCVVDTDRVPVGERLALAVAVRCPVSDLLLVGEAVKELVPE